MATVTMTPACNTNLSKTSIYHNNNSRFHDNSFSSYLSNTEEVFIKKLVGSTFETSSVSLKDPPYQIDSRKQKTEDGEISIFSAEKYFNGRIDENSGTKRRPQKDGRVELQAMKPKTAPGTPSSRSEISSKSHNLLLPVRSRDPFPNGEFKANGNKFLSIFGCHCSDKKSVDIDEKVEENTTYRNNCDHGEVNETPVTILPIEMHPAPVSLIRIKQTPPESRLAFLTSNSGVGKLTIKMQLAEKEEEEEKARNSLEVFGSPILNKRNITSSMEKKLTKAKSDSTPRIEENSVTSLDGGANGDIDSDSSSDLFEIKSLTSNPHPFFSRQLSGSMSSCVSPLTCYEPSEASIEWSVVTASSTATMFTNFEASKTTKNTTPTKGKSGMGRRPSMLSGCRSYKAVKVVEDPYRISDKSKSSPQRHHRLDSFTPITRFQADTKVMTLIPRMHNVH